MLGRIKKAEMLNYKSRILNQELGLPLRWRGIEGEAGEAL